MEEKERYEIHIYDDICVDLYDNGVLDKSINDTYKLEELLNQQDKRIKELEEENEQLKKQLAEKEKEITKLKSENHALMSDNAYQEADIFELIQNPAIQNQDKISFAVEQIIKTKETLIKFLQNDGFYENEWYDLFDEIDNQFKQLKEKNNATRKN